MFEGVEFASFWQTERKSRPGVCKLHTRRNVALGGELKNWSLRGLARLLCGVWAALMQEQARQQHQRDIPARQIYESMLFHLAGGFRFVGGGDGLVAGGLGNGMALRIKGFTCVKSFWIPYPINSVAPERYI